MKIPKQIRVSEQLAGLIYAYDPNRVLTSSENSQNGVPYTCPICGCRMHPTTTKSGKRIFVRMPGEVHTSSVCCTLEKKPKKYTFESVSPERLICSLCRAVPRREANGGSNGGGGGSSSDAGEKVSEITTLPYSSLKQIAESGIESLKPEDKQGDFKVSDFIITYKYGETFFTDPMFELGSRIVYARFLWADDRTKSITFSQYKPKSYSVKFRLVFLRNKDYKKYRNKFIGPVIDANGRTCTIKLHDQQDVLIAYDQWTLISKVRCKTFCSTDKFCDTCRGTYQAIFTNPKQIYLVPAVN